LLPQAPLFPQSTSECTTFAAKCYQVVDNRRTVYQQCNAAEMGKANPINRFRDVSFPGCPGAAYKAYTSTACDSRAESYECGLASCRSQVADCQEKIEANRSEKERGNSDASKVDLYEVIFKGGKKWHETQLKLRQVNARSKSIIRRIVEHNFAVIEKRHREMLRSVNDAVRKAEDNSDLATLKPFESRSEIPSQSDESSFLVSRLPNQEAQRQTTQSHQIDSGMVPERFPAEPSTVSVNDNRNPCDIPNDDRCQPKRCDSISFVCAMLHRRDGVDEDACFAQWASSLSCPSPRTSQCPAGRTCTTQ
jgi:hypothetical protein